MSCDSKNLRTTILLSKIQNPNYEEQLKTTYIWHLIYYIEVSKSLFIYYVRLINLCL